MKKEKIDNFFLQKSFAKILLWEGKAEGAYRIKGYFFLRSELLEYVCMLKALMP